jgi:glycerol-3-phosphate O-acyltransferase
LAQPVFSKAAGKSEIFSFSPARMGTVPNKNQQTMDGTGSEWVILLHGLARSSRSMTNIEKALLKLGYNVKNVDYDATKFPVEFLAKRSLKAVIEQVRQSDPKRIHFVTHSMGGILLRYYRKHNDLPSLGRVVMISPPNQGSELVDRLRGTLFFRAQNGPAGHQLGTGPESMPNQLGPHPFEAGVIAGNRSFNPVYSWMLPGPDDGVVAVERTKVAGMKDFIVLPHSHTFIMKADDTIVQILHFLKYGEFDHQSAVLSRPVLSSRVTLPLWLVLLGGALTLWTVISRFFLPGVRWYFRRKSNIIIREINKKLELELPEFKLTRRRILIDRLAYDSQVMDAAKAFSLREDVPPEVAMNKVRRYAREIVPSFNAYLYFRIGSWISRSIVRFLYRARVGYVDEEALGGIKSDSSVVFLMNHRSNMDYILLGYLSFSRSALSFAVGEWARFWPVQQLARAMGAFFVRRNSQNPLYRRVLARYIQMATEEGVAQAIFPEGGLSRDGRMGEPRIGILDYMLRSYDKEKARDIVFIPVGVNYDRVLEDRSQLRRGDASAERKTRMQVLAKTASYVLKNMWLMLRGGWHRFGYAVANFGTPVSMKRYMEENSIDFVSLDKAERIVEVKKLAGFLMDKLARIIPAVPVSLAAGAFLADPSGSLSLLEVKSHVHVQMEQLRKAGAEVYLPRQDGDYTVEVGLRMLLLRSLVSEKDGRFSVVDGQIPLLEYYANSIAHFFLEE